jgi:hypothetical protein
MTSATANRATPLFPGWWWAAVALAFPIAGLLGRAAAGRVDEAGAALIGGIVTGAALGAAQWFAARGALGRPSPWIAASGIGYGIGLLAGAALVDYGTSLGELAAMGAVSGVALGTAQGAALAAQGQRRLAIAWAVAMPLLLAIGWSTTTVTGISVEDQFTVFGALGAIVFTLLSGLLLARFSGVAYRASGAA